MKTRYIFGVFAAAAMLAACSGGEQAGPVAPDDGTGAIPGPSLDAATIISVPVSTRGIVPLASDGQANDNLSTCVSAFGAGSALFPTQYYKYDPPVGTNNVGPISFTIGANNLVAWAARTNQTILGVIIKGGTEGFNLYKYDGTGFRDDSGLGTPTSQGVSHVSVCLTDEPFQKRGNLAVSKTALTSYERRYDWELDKTVSPDAHSLAPEGRGDAVGAPETGQSTWTIDVKNSGSTDRAWKVYGKITIQNSGNAPAKITSVLDVVEQPAAETNATVAAGCLNVIVPAQVGANPGEITCNYEAAVNSAAAGTNSVTIAAEKVSADDADPLVGDPFSIGFTFGDPTKETDKCVTLADARFGLNPLVNRTVCIGDSPLSIDIDETFGAYSYMRCGQQIEEKNTATLKGDETDLSASATVTITLDCGEGCTPGYWRNTRLSPFAAYIENTALGATKYNLAFGSPLAAGSINYAPMTFLAAMDNPGGGNTFAAASRQLMFHASAAYLNAKHLGYAINVVEVVDRTRAALASGNRTTAINTMNEFDRYNNASCPLSNR